MVLLNPLDQNVISTIYPPPTPAEVTKVFYCTAIQRMFLFLGGKNPNSEESGEASIEGDNSDTKGTKKSDMEGDSPDPKGTKICVYKCDQQTGTLEKLKESKSIKDYEGKSMNQAITCISTCYTKPPQYDCEIFSDLHKYKEPTCPDYDFIGTMDEINNCELDTFLIIGLSKGTIVFVRVNNLDHIYSRFSLHRQAVEQIHELRQHKVFLSICEELILKIWGFDGHREEVYQTFNIYRDVMTIMVSKTNQMLMCFASGDSEIFVWSQEKKQLQRIEVDKSDEHEDRVTCCDILESKGLYVTGDREGLVKIWNFKK